MTEKIREKIHEFVGIAKECPENLQAKCFELLLAHYLSMLGTKDLKDHEGKREEKKDKNGIADSEVGVGKGAKQKDIFETDLHVKVRQFLKKNGLTVNHINQIFYKEQGEIKPLYDDLKSTKASESQIRIALLHALKNAIQEGEFQFNGEEVRAETQVRKCYDANNFAANFKNNKHLFDGFETYNKTTPIISVSTEGKEKLSEIIKELQ